MVKTKEIECSLFIESEECEVFEATGIYRYTARIAPIFERLQYNSPIKAKLIIELPEKKIEVTESQIRDAVKYGIMNQVDENNLILELFGGE